MITDRDAALQQKYAKRFRLTKNGVHHLLRPRILEQLELCHSDSERRLLLGISRKLTDPPLDVGGK